MTSPGGRPEHRSGRSIKQDRVPDKASTISQCFLGERGLGLTEKNFTNSSLSACVRLPISLNYSSCDRISLPVWCESLHKMLLEPLVERFECLSGGEPALSGYPSLSNPPTLSSMTKACHLPLCSIILSSKVYERMRAFSGRDQGLMSRVNQLPRIY
jgi:hypothetical protein